MPERGVDKVARPKMAQDKLNIAPKMYGDKYSIAEITEATGISKPTLYRYIREQKANFQNRGM